MVVQDAYRYNPWRAPGYAPVIDACGQAGGKLKSQNIGGDSIFTDTHNSLRWGTWAPNWCGKK